MSDWSTQRVLDVSPDDSSTKAARKLAKPGPWSDTGATDSLLWGKCQGSGKKPYQVGIDLDAPAYRCSCPSRKFPCKHALALLMLFTETDDVAAMAQPADFAEEWVSERAERAEKASAKAAKKAATPIDPAAIAKRDAERAAAMAEGLAEFELWLQDVARTGAGSAIRDRNARHRVAARLVDAKCPGLAEQVRDADQWLYATPHFADNARDLLGRWWLLASMWRRRDALTVDAFAAVRAALGWSWQSAEITAGSPHRAELLVAGIFQDDTYSVSTQRTWFMNTSTAQALVSVDFAGGGQALTVPHLAGATLDVAFYTYPGLAPKRCLIAEATPSPNENAGALQTLAMPLVEAVERARALAAQNPLAVRVPLCANEIRVSETHVVASDRTALPLVGEPPWQAIAVTGSAPCTVFGEWEPRGLRLLTCFFEGEVITL